MAIKIGITERGDAGIDLSWFDHLYKVDGVVLITKNITDKFMQCVLTMQSKHFPTLIHATITGHGRTVVEPHVPDSSYTIQRIKELIDKGFPQEHIVIRIDPILPTTKGLETVKRLLQTLESEIPNFRSMRIRISVIDDYRHVKQRFKNANLPTVYPDGQFYATDAQFQAVIQTLLPYKDQIECCAEPKLGIFKQQGCISLTDIQCMNLPITNDMFKNPQNRYGCTCLSCKTELLNNRYQCPHQCKYCYWKDDPKLIS